MTMKEYMAIYRLYRNLSMVRISGVSYTIVI